MADLYFHVLLEEDQSGCKYPRMRLAVFESGRGNTPILLLDNHDIYQIVSESGWDAWGQPFMNQMEIRTKHQRDKGIPIPRSEEE